MSSMNTDSDNDRPANAHLSSHRLRTRSGRFVALALSGILTSTWGVNVKRFCARGVNPSRWVEPSVGESLMSVLNLVVLSFLKSIRAKKFLATMSALVVLVGMLLGARIASADEVWVQSYERTSQAQACVAQPGETPWQASWGTDSSWTPGWEQWANAGKGGWTCNRSITWARTPVAGGSSSAQTYALGDTGPGGGLVFLISGGKTYEMAENTWGAASTDTDIAWCSNTTSSITGADGLAVGTGSANTTAMQPGACSSGAGVSARAYRGGGFTDWFLPSKDELNAMWNYSLVTGFPTATYGFAFDEYWSSSQSGVSGAWSEGFGDAGEGDQYNDRKRYTSRVRPVRAF